MGNTITEFDDSNLSDFNASIATLMRIHEIKKWLIITFVSKDYSNYLSHLLCFFKELSVIMTATDLASKDGDGLSHMDKFDIALKLYLHGTPLTDDTLNSLVSWELELRRVDQDKDMNLKKKGSARWAMAARQ